MRFSKFGNFMAIFSSVFFGQFIEFFFWRYVVSLGFYGKSKFEVGLPIFSISKCKSCLPKTNMNFFIFLKSEKISKLKTRAFKQIFSNLVIVFWKSSYFRYGINVFRSFWTWLYSLEFLFISYNLCQFQKIFVTF